MSDPTGYLEVICGPMYSGKTEELIRQVKRAIIGKKKVQVFKHKIDTRYGSDHKVYSHAGITFDAQLVTTSEEITQKIKPSTQLIAIDEAQWFGDTLVPVIQKFLDNHKHVLVSGLPMTFDRQAFPPMPALMTIADRVTKLSAVCSICGNDAIFHKRVTSEGPEVSALVADPGFVSKLDADVFQARCRNCFDKKP